MNVTLRFFLFGIALLFFNTFDASAQIFAGLSNQDHCVGSNNTEQFSVVFVDFGTFAPTSFTVETTTVTLMVNTPTPNGSSSISQTVAGVDYQFIAGRDAGGNIYSLSLFISGDITLSLNGMDVQFKATNASTTVSSSVAELLVKEPVEIFIDAPITFFNT